MKFSAFRLYRAKRFRLLALLKHWQRSVAVLGTLIVLFMSQDSTQYWMRFGYLLIALGYLWTDTYYAGRSIERKYKQGARIRELRKALHQASSPRPQ